MWVWAVCSGINNPEYRYFGHEIYLLPSQMIVEHYHVASPDYPAKHELAGYAPGGVYNWAWAIPRPTRPLCPRASATTSP